MVAEHQAGRTGAVGAYQCIDCGETPREGSYLHGKSRLYTVECTNAKCKTRAVVQAMTPQEALRLWNQANAIRKGQWY